MKKTKCFCCFKELEYEDYHGELDESSIVYDGTSVIMSGGYGSRFDMSQIVAAFCDDCIEKAIKNNAGKILITEWDLVYEKPKQNDA